MGVILDIVAPVFIIVGLGYLAAVRGFIDTAGFRGLNDFTFNLAAPALLFVGRTSGHAGGGPAAAQPRRTPPSWPAPAWLGPARGRTSTSTAGSGSVAR